MNLPPALTWLNLFPQGTPCVSDDGPPWFRAMLSHIPRGHDGEAVRIAWGRSWDELPDPGESGQLVCINCSGINERKLRDAGFRYARRYAVLPNLEKARWFVPLDSPSVAAAGMSLYTPSRRSAHLKKLAVRLAARSRIPLWYRDEIWVAAREQPAMEESLKHIVRGTRFRVALSSGAPEPAINRKASASVISPNGRVMGFIKIAGSEISRRIIEHEAQILPVLWKMHVRAPVLLFAGEVGGRYLTAQTPLPGRPPACKMTAAHHGYLRSLRRREIKPADQTQMVATLPGRIAALPASAGQRSADLAGSLDAIMPVLARTDVPSTVVHGDFTPWNLRTSGGEISAFDWEYAELDGLPLIDETHFLLQVGYQLKGWTPQRGLQCLAESAQGRRAGLEPQQIRAIQAVYLIDNLVRLLGEGYDPNDHMLCWYAQVLNELAPPAELILEPKAALV